MKNFVQDGNAITFTAAADTAGGKGVLVGKLFGVNAYTVKTGEEGEMVTVGVYDLDKLSAQAWTPGTPVYFDDTAKVATSTVGSNVLIGHAILPAANPSAIGRVRLSV